MPSGNYKYQFRLVMLGHIRTGKTRLISRFSSNSPVKDTNIYYMSTEFEPCLKVVEVGGDSIVLEIVDTPGNIFYSSEHDETIPNAAGYLLVYDITCSLSFEQLDFWLDKIKKHGNPDAVIMLVGNKADLEAERAVSRDEGREFANKNIFLHVEASAKAGDVGVTEAFLSTAKAIYNKISIGTVTPNSSNSGIKTNPGIVVNTPDRRIKYISLCPRKIDLCACYAMMVGENVSTLLKLALISPKNSFEYLAQRVFDKIRNLDDTYPTSASYRTLNDYSQLWRVERLFYQHIEKLGTLAIKCVTNPIKDDKPLALIRSYMGFGGGSLSLLSMRKNMMTSSSNSEAYSAIVKKLMEHAEDALREGRFGSASIATLQKHVPKWYDNSEHFSSFIRKVAEEKCYYRFNPHIENPYKDPTASKISSVGICYNEIGILLAAGFATENRDSLDSVFETSFSSLTPSTATTGPGLFDGGGGGMPAAAAAAATSEGAAAAAAEPRLLDVGGTADDEVARQRSTI